ncbi:MAG: beta-lactamase family protein [Candidatus Thiosymbion ectosymbiont of Robbea hypermnestra]|nr:beta-lactamase family protein [Candidatus Thiosymbion ectosymbiont of Robbea hypermnestra]
MYFGPNPRAFGHDGHGGSFASADPEAKVALGYTKTLLHTDQVPVRPETLSKTRFIETVYANL